MRKIMCNPAVYDTPAPQTKQEAYDQLTAIVHEKSRFENAKMLRMTVLSIIAAAITGLLSWILSQSGYDFGYFLINADVLIYFIIVAHWGENLFRFITNKVLWRRAKRIYIDNGEDGIEKLISKCKERFHQQQERHK